jgi:hypothetical protein
MAKSRMCGRHMVVRRQIVHLLKIVLAGKIYFQNCPPMHSPGRKR